MYLKIRRNWGAGWSEVPEITVECDRYDRSPYDPEHAKAESAESMFCDIDGDAKPLYTIMTFKNKKFVDMFLVGHATIFVMSNEGKTIDTIYA